jgi:hypothetical protein
MAICSCVNCCRWRDSKATLLRGTKGKEQWEASKRMYKCIHMDKHTMEHYILPDNEPIDSVILGSIFQDGACSPTSVSHKARSDNRRATEAIRLESDVGKSKLEVKADDDISDMNIADGCVFVGVASPLIYCDLSTLCQRQNVRHRARGHHPHRHPKELLPPPASKTKSATCA